MNACQLITWVFVDNLSNLVNLIFLCKTTRSRTLEFFHSLWDFLLTPIIRLPELNIGVVMFGDVLPAFLIASITHSNLLLTLSDILTVKEKIRTTKLVLWLHVTEYLPAVPTVVLPAHKCMKLFIALEAIFYILIGNPFFFGAEWCLDDTSDLFVHIYKLSTVYHSNHFSSLNQKLQFWDHSLYFFNLFILFYWWAIYWFCMISSLFSLPLLHIPALLHPPFLFPHCHRWTFILCTIWVIILRQYIALLLIF